MATDLASKDAAKTRIINHMNADHQDSLIRYLQHYAQVSSFSARNAQISDISFSSLTILSSDKTPHTIPINPAMTAWSEARPRVVAMDAKATAGLNKSGITVKRYKEPRGFMAVILILVVATLVLFSRRAHFKPGSVIYDMGLHHVPKFANFCWNIQPLLFSLILMIHTAEAAFMLRNRLERHTVRMFSRVWWLWLLSAFTEGLGSFQRFDEVVKEEELKKAAAKH